MPPFSIAYTHHCANGVSCVAVADTIKPRLNDETTTPVVAAVGSHRSAGLVLIKHESKDGRVSELPGPATGATALLVSNKEACILVGGADGSLLQYPLSAACAQPANSKRSQRTLLQPASEQSSGALISLSLHQPSRTLAAGGGRYIHLINLKEAQIVQRLGPLPCEVLFLAWLGSSTMLAGCAAGLHMWQDIGGAGAPPAQGDAAKPANPSGLVLPSPPDLVYSAFAANSRAGHAAASTANTQQVIVWRKIAGSKSGSPQAITLSSYKTEVNALAWDGEGRLLATSEGSAVVVWDFERSIETVATRCMAVGGHDPKSQITCLEYDPLNEYLISAGDDGNVAMYATAMLATSDPKHPVPPAVRLSLGMPRERLSTVKWLLGSPEHLVVVGAGGLLTVVRINRVAWRDRERGRPKETLVVNLNVQGDATAAQLAEAAARLSIAARSAVPPNAQRPAGPRAGPVRPAGPQGGSGMGPRRLSGGYGAANGTAGPHVGGERAGRGNGTGPSHGIPGPAPPTTTTQPETPPLLRKGSSDKVTPPGSGGGPSGGGRGRGMPIAVQGGRTNGREGRDPRVAGSSSRSLTSGGPRGPRAASPARSTSSKESLTHAHSLGRTSSGSHSMQPSYMTAGVPPWGMASPVGGVPFAGMPYAAATHPALLGHAMPAGLMAHPTMMPYYTMGPMQPVMAYDDKSAGGSGGKGSGGGAGPAGGPYPPGMAVPPGVHPMFPQMAVPIPAGMYPSGPQAQMQRQMMAMQYMQHQQHMAMMHAQMQHQQQQQQQPGGGGQHGPTSSQSHQGGGGGGGGGTHTTDSPGTRGGGGASKKDAPAAASSTTAATPSAGVARAPAAPSGAPPPAEGAVSPRAPPGGPPKPVVVPHPGAQASGVGGGADKGGAGMSTSTPHSNPIGGSGGGGGGGVKTPVGPPPPGGFVHDDASTLYIGNLATEVEEGALHQLFVYFGQLRAVQVIRDKATNVSRGFGFVSFVHANAAQEAMRQVDGRMLYGPFEGRQIKVAPSSKRQHMQHR